MHACAKIRASTRFRDEERRSRGHAVCMVALSSVILTREEERLPSQAEPGANRSLKKISRHA
jgi:hypothetical protein